ncbi:MAG: hypothetical protein AAFN77_02780 [Planctomycetota bacterium]
MDAKTKKALRKRLYVDELQRTMIVRTILHWYFYMSAILLVVCLGAVWMDPNQLAIKYVFKSFVYFAPGIVASILLLPLFIYDMLRATNRIAGPIYRLRGQMAKLRSGEQVGKLKFRDGDAFQELADDFNELVAYVESMRDQDESDRVESEELATAGESMTR